MRGHWNANHRDAAAARFWRCVDIEVAKNVKPKKKETASAYEARLRFVLNNLDKDEKNRLHRHGMRSISRVHRRALGFRGPVTLDEGATH